MNKKKNVKQLFKVSRFWRKKNWLHPEYFVDIKRSICLENPWVIFLTANLKNFSVSVSPLLLIFFLSLFLSFFFFPFLLFAVYFPTGLRGLFTTGTGDKMMYRIVCKISLFRYLLKCHASIFCTDVFCPRLQLI